MRNTFNAVKISPNNKTRWNQLLLNSIYPSYLASISYQYAKKSLKKDIQTFVYLKDEIVVAGAHYVIKKSKGNIFRIAEISSGIVFKDDPEKTIVEFIIKHFLNWAKKHNASYISIIPWLPKEIAGNQTAYYNLFNNVLEKHGFKIKQQGRHSYWINLKLNEDDILKKMKRQTRYRVRQGLRSNIDVKYFTKPDESAFESFWNLYKNLGANKGFDTLPKTKLKNEIFGLLEEQLATLYILHCNNKIINTSFASTFGIASYMHGAINLEFKNINNCPSPGQVAQWEMIKHAKHKGASVYDMGFCPGPVPYKNHPRYNIWNFKYSFGGDHVQFLPVYGKILKPIRGRLIHYFKK
jgi:lipid II:glycine glycyltransferase (peptidoglycan interpeptide bridge formation enzyme)